VTLQQWCVVRDIGTARFQLVSAISFETYDDATEHLELVRRSVRPGLRPHYRLARLIVDDPEVLHRVVVRRRNAPVGMSPLFDWDDA
jgi:hypothetical protein